MREVSKQSVLQAMLSLPDGVTAKEIAAELGNDSPAMVERVYGSLGPLVRTGDVWQRFRRFYVSR